MSNVAIGLLMAGICGLIVVIMVRRIPDSGEKKDSAEETMTDSEKKS